MPLWSFPLDLAIRADTGQALGHLADYASELLTAADHGRIHSRRAVLTHRHQCQRAEWAMAAQAPGETAAIPPEWLCACLGAFSREVPECVFVDESVTNNQTVWQHVDVGEPETWFGSGGSGLGWGLGAALGVKLASGDRPVVLLVGDGSFVFGEPVATLWAAQAQAAPFLTVVFDNSCYNATKRSLVGAYPEGHSVKADHFIGTDLLPAPRYDLIAQSVGAYGERVDDPSQVLPALRRGLTRVRGGQCAIIDVVLARP